MSLDTDIELQARSRSYSITQSITRGDDALREVIVEDPSLSGFANASRANLNAADPDANFTSQEPQTTLHHGGDNIREDAHAGAVDGVYEQSTDYTTAPSAAAPVEDPIDSGDAGHKRPKKAFF